MTATTVSRSAGSRSVPGDTAMWVFVLGDVVFFAVYFIVYMVYRARDPSLFLAAQRHLSLASGIADTLLLLAGSRLVAQAVKDNRAQRFDRAVRAILAAAGCGVAFLAIKGHEWYAAIAHGYTLPHDDFFMFYFMLTGVHVLHVFAGLVLLGVIVHELRTVNRRRDQVVTTAATYWHMVDLLWLALFALLYAMR